MDLENKLTDEEFNRLLNCQTEKEWSEACDAVKAARNGLYPTEWFARMNRAGLMSLIFNNFKTLN